MPVAVNPHTAMFGTGCNLTPLPKTCMNHYFFDPSSFTDNALGTLGNTTRNFFHGPGFWNTDFALRKVTRITEGTSIEMRFEAFNLLNHVNFANPVGDVADPNFGRISSIRTGSNSRLLQLGAKFSF